jgi:pyridoxamine 5'-phosphate oxidase family protein
MSVFTEKEREYLSSGVRLGRLATVGSDGTPHVVPTAFRYNPGHDSIDIGGHDFAKRKKYRDVLRNPKVAFVVDDIASVNPWRVRGIEIRGEAEVLDIGGTELMQGFDPEMFRLTPQTHRELGTRGTDVVQMKIRPLTGPARMKEMT